jgi:hypothetical protein
MTEADPRRVLHEVARAAEVSLDELVGRPKQFDPLTIARLASALLLRESGCSHRAIARALNRKRGWVWYALAIARETPEALALADVARAKLGRTRPTAAEIDVILRGHRERASRLG